MGLLGSLSSLVRAGVSFSGCVSASEGTCHPQKEAESGSGVPGS